MITKILKILGLQPLISKYFLDHYFPTVCQKIFFERLQYYLSTFNLFWSHSINSIHFVGVQLQGKGGKVHIFCVSTKVIYTKYSKHWPYTVAHAIDCVCLNVKSWFKSWVFPFTFQAYTLPHTLNCMCVSLLKFNTWGPQIVRFHLVRSPV